MKRRAIVFLFLLGILVCGAVLGDPGFEDTFEGGPEAKADPALLFHDGFESGGWRARGYHNRPVRDSPAGREWLSAQMQGEYSGRVVSAPDPARAGRYSMRFEWRPEGYDGTNSGKKAMLHWAKPRQARGTERWYGFSVYFPSEGMRPEKAGMLFFQLHGSPNKDIGEPYRRPLASMSIRGEEFGYGFTWDADELSPKNKNIAANFRGWRVKPESSPYDRWVDIVWHVRLDWEGKGLVEVWIDGKQVGRHRDVSVGYNDVVGPYPSLGFYWYAGKGYEHRHWMYLDEVRIGNEMASYKTVAPRD